MELIRLPTHRVNGDWVYINPEFVTHLSARQDGHTDVHLVKKEDGLPGRVTVTLSPDDSASAIAGRQVPGFRAGGEYISRQPRRFGG